MYSKAGHEVRYIYRLEQVKNKPGHKTVSKDKGALVRLLCNHYILYFIFNS
jgi:hypothetical protein